MFVKPLPRYVIAKPLASGLTGFYFNIPTNYWLFWLHDFKRAPGDRL